MNKPAISIRNLGKRYKLGAIHSHDTLRDYLASGIKYLFGANGRERLKLKSKDNQRLSTEENKGVIWALRDISLDIHEGEVIGIIGRNGAGKSTLLKLISEITEPTEGEIRIFGRVASLLEVGTGFHPELSGRENIYLNGSILGMTRKEIKARFDEIVAFAEVERFIDTPVKRYSSGMYLRLAFAVAAHLEPEILLVDEVLAVGDINFQRKCLGKMGDVSKSGRTILFVSHNMGAIGSLCSRTCWIDRGRLCKEGPTKEVIEAYLSGSAVGDAVEGGLQMRRICGGDEIRLTKVELFNGDFNESQFFNYNDTMIMRFHFQVINPKRKYFAIEWTICTKMGTRIIYGSSSPQQELLITPTAKTGCVECCIPHIPLAEGAYQVNCSLSIPHRERLDLVEDTVNFQVVACDPYKTGFNLSDKVASTTLANSWTISNGAKAMGS